MSAATAKAWRLNHNEQAKAYKARWRERARQAAACAEPNAVLLVTLPRVYFLSGESSRAT